METSNTTKKRVIIVLFLLFILALVLFLIFRQRPNLGYGTQEPDPTQFGETGEPLAKPRTEKFYAPDKQKYFELAIGQDAHDTILQIPGTSTQIKGVAFGKWSSDSQYIIFTKAEGEDTGEHTDIVNNGNLWKIKYDGTEEKIFFDTEELTAIDFEANSSWILFVNEKQIGRQEIKDPMRIEVLDTYEMDHIYEGDQLLPTITKIDESTFTVEFVKGGVKQIKEYAL